MVWYDLRYKMLLKSVCFSIFVCFKIVLIKKFSYCYNFIVLNVFVDIMADTKGGYLTKRTAKPKVTPAKQKMVVV